ncbi:Uncharacterised protein [Serratia fonticola]|uniref:Uncharacterized protein n=1 Tax=Serratia fonticola TaxID=47917 RepID=A0A3S4XAX4_SERFO|nr:Uncharacterised protein [Serratia fonticola]
MSVYNGIQKKVTDYRAAQKQYWLDLQQRAAHFKSGLIKYLGVEGLELCDKEDNKYPVVLVGEMNDENVTDLPSTKFAKIDGEENCLHFLCRSIYLNMIVKFTSAR